MHPPLGARLVFAHFWPLTALLVLIPVLVLAVVVGWGCVVVMVMVI